MRFLFLNQYFPPDPAPTGVLLREVADDLAAHGHTVDFVASRQDYRAGQARRGRLKREVLALARMLVDGARRPRADVVISASSPPCLLLVATLVARRHRAKSIHWIMDLYPEIAVALEEVPPPLGRMISWLMHWGYRRAHRVVVLDADMAARVRAAGVEPEIIRPWVFASVLARPQPALDPMEPWTWIYSGNLGRAHEWETLLAAQALIEPRDPKVRLLFQGGGPSWPAAQARATELGLQRCAWQPYVEQSELRATLLRAQVCAVTQLPAAQGCLWPSKLGLVLTLPRAILWIGPTDGAIARELSGFPHAGIFAPGDAAGVAEWLLDRERNGHGVPQSATHDPAAERAQSLTAWRALMDAAPRPAGS